jgi:hypothetical protein
LLISNLRRLSRRRFVSLASAAAATTLVRGPHASAQSSTSPESPIIEITNSAPYFAQGGTGVGATANCGPATVAAAINYSGVAYRTVLDVRTTLTLAGPTDLDQWAWLLDAYGAPWYPIWSQPEMDQAIRTGHVIVIATWMADLATGPDFEEAYGPFWGQAGRYDAFSLGHAMLITGIADGGANYLVHDPNVFAGGTYYYGDGVPKGSYRRYPALQVWSTIGTNANGLGLAVAPPNLQLPAAPSSVKLIRPEKGERFAGPGGGHAPERGERGVTGVIETDQDRGVISSAAEDGVAPKG